MEFFSTCKGLPVHISDSGKGDKTVLLLHGYLETLYIWQEFTTLLSKDMRVVSIDLPGHGLTGTSEVNTMSFCADIAVSVLDKLNIEKAYVLGHSMGGYVALEAVKRYPDRFEGLIMMNSTPFPDSQEKREEREREILIILQKKMHMIARTSIPKMFAPENLVKMEEKILEIRETAEIHDPEGVVATLKGIMQREDNRDFMKSTETPLLVFLGRFDNYIKEEAVKEIVSTAGSSNVIMLEKSGHCGFLEEPVLCSQKLLEFINKSK
jgi:pimeloyl-ACP methyl ester carboxylesterase